MCLECTLRVVINVWGVGATTEENSKKLSCSRPTVTKVKIKNTTGGTAAPLNSRQHGTFALFSGNTDYGHAPGANKQPWYRRLANPGRTCWTLFVSTSSSRTLDSAVCCTLWVYFFNVKKNCVTLLLIANNWIVVLESNCHIQGRLGLLAERSAAMDHDLIWIRLNLREQRYFLIIYVGIRDICLPCPFCAAGLIPTCNTLLPPSLCKQITGIRGNMISIFLCLYLHYGACVGSLMKFKDKCIPG